jgi:DNA invertase Pin-like site-specific DNA recombinase
MEITARRGGIYGRISKDIDDDEHGVNNQLDAGRDHAKRTGVEVDERHVWSDNDISATYGAYREQYEAMMDAVKRGEIDVIIVFHTSRLWRNRKERAEGIEILKNAGVSVMAVKGPSLDMSTAYGRGMAGLLGEFDTMESEIKSERQALAARARAKAGQPPQGPRLLGYDSGSAIVEKEAAIVRSIFSRFYAGESINSIAMHLTETGVPTRNGGRWRNSSVRHVLTNPRYAGKYVYQRGSGGTETYAGTWPAIVEEWMFDAVNARLADPRRKIAHGTERKHLGSGLYLCPDGHLVRSQGTADRHRYRCSEGCVYRTGAAVDDAVTALIRARLERPDVAHLVNRPAGEEATAAAAELRKQHGRLVKVEADYDEDLIDGKRYKEKKAKIETEIAVAQARLARVTAGSEVAGVVTAPDPVKAFDGAPLGVKQAVIRFFCDVTLLPTPRGRRGFDPASIRITPKHPASPRLHAASAEGDATS